MPMGHPRMLLKIRYLTAFPIISLKINGLTTGAARRGSATTRQRVLSPKGFGDARRGTGSGRPRRRGGLENKPKRINLIFINRILQKREKQTQWPYVYIYQPLRWKLGRFFAKFVCLEHDDPFRIYNKSFI